MRLMQEDFKRQKHVWSRSLTNPVYCRARHEQCNSTLYCHHTNNKAFNKLQQASTIKHGFPYMTLTLSWIFNLGISFTLSSMSSFWLVSRTSSSAITERLLSRLEISSWRRTEEGVEYKSTGTYLLLFSFSKNANVNLLLIHFYLFFFTIIDTVLIIIEHRRWLLFCPHSGGVDIQQHLQSSLNSFLWGCCQVLPAAVLSPPLGVWAETGGSLWCWSPLIAWQPRTR